ncbi:PKD domain-containing protein [Pendulispora rubella]|uniref:PKD domain-containing protein n=1 Tax=Pendulispora rubella TaxID=2741070 RepID=A0ABZ2L3V1_9BACT
MMSLARLVGIASIGTACLVGCSRGYGLNGSPLANAGAPQTVPLGSTVTLDGSRSWDPDGDDIFFFWSVAKEPAGSSLGEIRETTPTVKIHPAVAGEYEIQLVVTDYRNSAVGISEVKITVT